MILKTGSRFSGSCSRGQIAGLWMAVNLNKWFPLRQGFAKLNLCLLEQGRVNHNLRAPPGGKRMRHVLSSVLALHWAVVFALLAYICMDGSRGIATALGGLGLGIQGSRFPQLENVAVVAPLS
ncbi:MAG: hypothetical protein J0H31_12215, partial [Alphaproteobacteria bacterium]|nr:hypothetical protein [Alphaproteobacteria bacterium]